MHTALFPTMYLYYILVLLVLSQTSQSANERAIFSPEGQPGSTKLLRMVADENSGRVYVGGVNRLYQLTENLELEAVVETGPRLDNPLCPPPNSECLCSSSSCKDFEKRNMDSFSKILVVDRIERRLIACSNLYQGHCDKHLLTNISKIDPPKYTMLVPNDQTSSVVMFIGPGPPNPATTHILYVAATRSTKGLPAYKDIVPALSIRNLTDFELVSGDILTPSRIEVEVQQRDLFRIDYVYGFGSRDFSYFLSVQKIAAITDSEKYVTQISRICQNDKSLYSYTEIPLECYYNGIHYNILRAAQVIHPSTELARSLGLPHIAPLTDMEHVLVGVFSYRQNSKIGSTQSAVCLYPLRDIRRKFTETIQRCFYGVGNTGPDHFVQPKGCLKTPFEIGDDYCGDHDINHPIKGTEPISRDAVIAWSDVNATSLAVTVANDFTVAIIGTEDGFLRKVSIYDVDTVKEYDKVLVETGSAIKKDMAFDRLENNLYVMTDTMVRRLPLENCESHNTCSECLGAENPYCGWCALDRRCVRRDQCLDSESAQSWVAYHTGSCPRIVAMPSHQAQKQMPTMVIMTVQSLPMSRSGGVYDCAFSGYGVRRTTRVIPFEDNQSENVTVKCATPTPNLLPVFPTGKDHIVMTLSLLLDGFDFLSTNFTFYDCGVHNTCTKCTTSEYPCWWCVEKSECLNNREQCNLNDVLITGKQVQGISDSPGPEYCPRVENSFNTTEILIPSGMERSLKVKALYRQSFQTDFKCVFNFKRSEETPAQLVTEGNEQFIICDPVLFEYPGSSHYINVPFSIVWEDKKDGRPKALDNPHNIQVQVYKCEEMAGNCGRCRTIDSRHGCGWCSGSQACTVKQHCATGPWLKHDHSCINPVIKSIYPITGPINGGTELTVSGENLGINAADTVATVAGIPCLIFDYMPSIQFRCKTGAGRRVQSGIVSVRIDNQYTAESEQSFHYVEPVLTGITPRYGSLSGGTHVTITGQNLDAGTTISLNLSNGTLVTSCTFIYRSLNSATCVTSASSHPYDVRGLYMTIDRSVITYDASNQFTILPDPIVTLVRPKETIFSGGTRVTVIGERLEIISRPRMIVYIEGTNITSSCEKVDREIKCITPSLAGASLPIAEPTSDRPLLLHYGFLFDNAPTLRNMTQVAFITTNTLLGSLSTGIPKYLIYFPNPSFDKFDDGIKQFFLTKNEYLTINGKHLNLALTEDDIKVTLDDLNCPVTSVSSTQLTCQPLEEDFSSIASLALVTVHIGNNVTFEIGNIQLDGTENMLLSWKVLSPIGAFVFIVLSIIIGVIIAYRKKSRERDDVLKRMKNQMDFLESRVAKECKEAFAELQTDMTGITNDIGGHAGIPFRDYRCFSMCVLFPCTSASDHPVFRPLDCDVVHTEALDKGMRNFNQLINNKTFLLIFIRTLEQVEHFTVREKVNVASLLSVILQNRMDYHTDVLKTLLAELIERAIEGKHHPKLLLRRTESVAEKMLTNWFTFLLYKFLRESAGEPLFVLYRAIKQQVEKGPIDGVTSEARYSLSEDKLIRQHVEYKSLTLRVLDPEATCTPPQLLTPNQPPPQEFAVRLLDCDTISQAKEKMLDSIYRNAPYSSRPHKDDLDLEYRTVTGRLKLQDEDVTTKSDGEYRKLNTLAHYRVPENALMALVPKPTPSSVSTMHLNDRYPNFQRFGSLPVSQSLLSNSNAINFNFDQGAKIYHLVKPSDSDNHKDIAAGSKMVSEVYLTRLLTTKGTLQQFVDDLFETIFSTVYQGSRLPFAIKHMFDFLDDQALLHGITDHETVHTWKSNSLPLRFWVNVIKNPEFVFDVHKSNIVDACLSVVAQTFMDSCSMSEQKLGKDSPSSKLLYAKDIPKYKKWVEKYYEDIKQMPASSDRDMNAMLAEESKVHQNEFNTSAALQELYHYASTYNIQLMRALEEDEFARNGKLAQRLLQVHQTMQMII